MSLPDTPDSQTPETPPTRRVVSVIPGTEREDSPKKDAALALSEAERVEVDGRQKFFALRERWSWWIIGWITGLIVFNVAITVMVGLKILDFASYQWFVTAVTVETFLQIVGMGYVAVRFLFSDVKPGSRQSPPGS